MNDRIAELMWQSAVPADQEVEGKVTVPDQKLDISKFTDLIIEDVLQILSDRKNYNKSVYTTWDMAQADSVVIGVADAIQKHFGTNKHFKVEDYGIMGRKISTK